jgi:ADP-ribosylglycohydrolase
MVDNGMLTLLGVIAATATSSAGLGVWISSKFDKQKSDFYRALEAQRKSVEQKVDDHEDIDHKRHYENIERFSDIREALALMGAGVPPTSKNRRS